MERFLEVVIWMSFSGLSEAVSGVTGTPHFLCFGLREAGRHILHS